MEPETESYLESRISALEHDIKLFGLAYDDLARLHRYKARLKGLQNKATAPEGAI